MESSGHRARTRRRWRRRAPLPFQCRAVLFICLNDTTRNVETKAFHCPVPCTHFSFARRARNINCQFEISYKGVCLFFCCLPACLRELQPNESFGEILQSVGRAKSTCHTFLAALRKSKSVNAAAVSGDCRSVVGNELCMFK